LGEKVPLSIRQRLEEIYHLLLSSYGPQHWWPADEPFEVIVGAILTQNTNWGNVEKAISNLKQCEALNPSALRQLPLEKLAELIYPCGYYRGKALKLKAFAEYLVHYGDSLERLFALDIEQLRDELLSIYGIGEETADSIILYAAKKPIFVIDAYTKRILSRLGLAPAMESYAAFQALFMDNLPPDEALYNEYHALLVRHGKEVCRKSPFCPRCCLSALCSERLQIF
jgi:endonuclease-3 related protein